MQDGNYAAFIENHQHKKYESGDFVYKDGKVLGKHKGIINYTIGQRKGLGISYPTPLYVIDKNVAENKVILGDNGDLMKSTVTAKDINLISVAKVEKPMKAKAKTRYNMKEQPGTLYQTDDNTLVFEFDEPQRAITPGQALVVYDGDVVVGGGTII